LHCIASVKNLSFPVKNVPVSLMTKKTFIILLFFICIKASNAFEDSDSLIIGAETWVKIDSIEIRGNYTTEDFVILREMTFQVGDEVNGSMIEFNRERIYSLGLFNFVKIFAKSQKSKITAVIDVEETWYIYPVPFLNIRDKDLDRASYGLSLLYRNFRGRNETIQAVASFGYDQFYLLSYYNPLISTSADLNLRTSLLYQTPQNKSLFADALNGDFFDYKFSSGMVTIGKRLNQFQ
jgi:outer membrane protein assembly factor BamA